MILFPLMLQWRLGFSFVGFLCFFVSVLALGEQETFDMTDATMLVYEQLEEGQDVIRLAPSSKTQKLLSHHYHPLISFFCLAAVRNIVC